jgi:hypothetical protein
MRTILWIIALFSCAACRGDDMPARASAAADSGAEAGASSAEAGEAASVDSGSQPRAGGIGIQFDPSRVKVSEPVGAMQVTAIDVRRAASMPDSPYVGTVRFRGEVELEGALMHFPGQGEKNVCFEADPETAGRLPRMRGDARRPWFCFENYAYAAERTAQMSAADHLRVRIDNFAINYAFSDVFNTARLLKVEQAGGGHAH